MQSIGPSNIASDCTDPTLYSLGIPAPPLKDLPSPMRDHSLPSNDAAEAFAVWVSSYYVHEPLTTASLSSLTRSEMLSKITHTPIPDSTSSNRRPTLSRMTTEELQTVTDYERTARTHVDILNVQYIVYADNVRRLISQTEVWPHLRVEFVWCDMAVGDCLYAVWGFVHMVEHLKSHDTTCRPVSVKCLRNTNHFVSILFLPIHSDTDL